MLSLVWVLLGTLAAQTALANVVSANQRQHQVRTLLEDPRPIGDGVDLRILPLGDSITEGQQSTDGNGYRLELYNKLQVTNQVEFIGQEHSGFMEKNRHEGHRGFVVEAVALRGSLDYADRPNLVLLIAGTNNIFFNWNVEGTPKELDNLIGNITSACPDAVLLVGSLPPILDPGRQQRLADLNEELMAVVRRHEETNEKVALVEMTEVGFDKIGPDTIHPNDEGYRIIADTWYRAIVTAGDLGRITPPVEIESTDMTTEDPATGTLDQEQADQITQELTGVSSDADPTAGKIEETMEDSQPGSIAPPPPQQGLAPQSLTFNFAHAKSGLSFVFVVFFLVIAGYGARRFISNRSRRYSPLPQY